MEESYDLVLVGTGFASAFFLHEYLLRAPRQARVLVLERGPDRDHLGHLADREAGDAEARAAVVNRNPEKPWVFRLSYGGASNCWWACTPRMLPADFELRTRHGIGSDWPLRYDDLEEYYCIAEELMAVSGPDDGSPFPRSRPYPQPPHRLSDPDKLLKAHFPDRFFVQPTARPSRTLPDGRPRCCASGVCHLCPIDSKFTILNGMRGPLREDPRVTLLCGADVRSLELQGGAVRGVRYVQGGREQTVAGDLVGLGANAIFNAAILLRSGLEHPQLGRGLVEQVGMVANVHLDGVDGFQGSTSITGNGYMLYDGEHRSERPAALMETINVPQLRDERGRWRQRVICKFIFEELRDPQSRVEIDPADPDRPVLTWAGHSDYARRGIEALPDLLEGVLEPLPVEETRIHGPLETESHVMGTTVMGDDPETSVVDRDQVHHQLRNLLVMGTGTFPTASPANPTLTLCALTLRSARVLLGGAG